MITPMDLNLLREAEQPSLAAFDPKNAPLVTVAMVAVDAVMLGASFQGLHSALFNADRPVLERVEVSAWNSAARPEVIDACLVFLSAQDVIAQLFMSEISGDMGGDAQANAARLPQALGLALAAIGRIAKSYDVDLTTAYMTANTAAALTQMTEAPPAPEPEPEAVPEPEGTPAEFSAPPDPFAPVAPPAP